MASSNVYSEVSKHYGNAARLQDDGNYSSRVANAFGYSKEDLEGMPEEANLGLSCGNPFAIANLKEGETVVDLGSGAGFDVFQAAKKVGKTGKSIGVDFNQDMLDRANKIKSKLSADNISFVESSITKISLPSDSVDCIISNCVINLVPEDEKQLVFNEMFRLLKSGGRVAVSDILAKVEMPERIRNDMALYVGCIAGASQVQAYERYFQEAGFRNVLMVDAKSDLNVYYTAEGESGPCCGPPLAAKAPEAKACCGPPAKETKTSCCAPKSNGTSEKAQENSQRVDFNEFAASYKIFATKA